VARPGPVLRGIHWNREELFELKSAHRVLGRGERFENNWGDAQTGFRTSTIKSANQDGRLAVVADRPTSLSAAITSSFHSGNGIEVIGSRPATELFSFTTGSDH